MDQEEKTNNNIQPDYPFKIAFLLSGGGTTLENLLDHIVKGKVKANVSVVISSKKSAYGIERAKNWKIPSHIIAYSEYKNNLEDYSSKITEVIDSYDVDLIVFGGFLSLYFIPNKYKNCVINIHPSLIPAFSGKGYYGIKVHKAVIDYGVKFTGATVHFVDQEYDKGAIIAQEVVPVVINDSAESLQEKVMQIEHKLYPKVIQAFVENRLHITERKVEIF